MQGLGVSVAVRMKLPLVILRRRYDKSRDVCG